MLDRHHILELFFKAWVDETCNNRVTYTSINTAHLETVSIEWTELYRVDFESAEDAVALKLKDVPEEFKKYIEILV